MIKRILAATILVLLIFSLSFALDIRDILKQNIGHNVKICLKNTQDIESWGKIIDISDNFLITEYEKKTAYIRIDEIAIVIIDNDTTRKK